MLLCDDAFPYHKEESHMGNTTNLKGRKSAGKLMRSFSEEVPA